jgi:hypothetical protein
MLAKELIEIVERLQKFLKEIAGAGISVSQWAGVALLILINIALAIAIIAQFIKLMDKLISLLLPITRKHKCLNVKEVLPNGIETVYSYDIAGRLIGQQTSIVWARLKTLLHSIAISFYNPYGKLSVIRFNVIENSTVTY